MKTVSLYTVFKRVAEWNKARYPRVYNHELAVSLLEEELTEYFEAETSVDQLDAICDLVYVSIGILWKTNACLETLDFNKANSQALALLTGNDFEPIYLVAAILAIHKYSKDDYSVTMAIQTVIIFCMAQMAYIGLDHTEAMQALLVVCDCNDTKTVEKVEPHVKANGKDKGKNFISPEYALSIILADMEKRRNGDKRNS